ncbi:probable G-protein coupled receptor 158 isoform X1 [Anopheles albimanus]|uniref:probable G-protein coupled receptor 158 isoform X1 n=1 Tax=Anopheles albimanus TaxID=7167 RepID=UPI001641D4AC|nr:probable G-protein coupled receptor 158 isoform X1 [Anopheles albimanus]XP_035796203.1 probable G-protein coupled receptor 158 isoform X1 [Anopheles albimanus]XP_035796204.1 probable G-protein coupled receptor 158 isoform X1 [Anopheles albimanus]XP_035796205.1 probable G-protein coupled receptor 158 isoform X1 [Anopheles albimanus]XP_035796206.1 probable G-protein coupled receptor 158 isoform X1 [Anopheles albimanus]XP_035796208.1 probable G-protein coupled receptor 158 isoform X1 [Anophele
METPDAHHNYLSPYPAQETSVMGHRYHRNHHQAHDQQPRTAPATKQTNAPTTTPWPLPSGRQRSPAAFPSCRRWSLLVLVTLLVVSAHSLEQQLSEAELLADQQQADDPTLLSTITSLSSASTSASTSISATLPPCEQRALDEVPPDPFYDVSDITIGAAKSFAEYLATKKIDSVRSDDRKLALAREKANELATGVLKQDDGLLLAVGIASPKLPLAVVQFRGQIDSAHVNLSESRNFLSTYWRELGVAWNQSNGAQFWGAPFRDCGPLYNRWLWPYSVTVESQGYKIVASAFIAADVDQCNDALEAIFGRRHVCDRESTFCLLSELDASKPRGKYTCVCRPDYYIPNESIQGFSSDKNDGNITNFSCIPCPSACECDSAGSCNSPDEDFSTETLMKATIGAILGACMLCCLVLALIVFRQRKCKTIATGMWTILETILFGILLLYLAVALHFLQASNVRCLLEPWCRELGFIICYGAIVLKLYRHLVEFRTRKAHRWVVRDLDLLRYLCAMIVAVLCYLAAFTATSLDFLQYSELVWQMERPAPPGTLDATEQVASNMCRPLRWDYVTQAGELLILGFGLQLAIASRNANTQFRERQFLVASILIEFLVSSTFYILRFWYLDEFNPSTLFLALFVRSQLTNTVTLGLIFLPKLWYQHKQVRSLAHDVSFRLPVDAFKGAHESTHHGGALGTYAGICMGDPEVGDVTISEMSPEDIRAELKRLYTQLEYLKNKTLRQDNPHISKRRGGRKVAHRRFSLQKKGSREKALSAKHRNNRPAVSEVEVTEAEPSRTPEDSVCSVEGPTDTGTGTGEISGISSTK